MVASGLARIDSPGCRRRVSDAKRPRRMLPIDDDDDDELRFTDRHAASAAPREASVSNKTSPR